MNTTTVTVTKPLKDHLKDIRDSNSLPSLNATIKHVLDQPADTTREVPDGNLMDNPKTIKVEKYTLQWLKRVRDNEGYDNYEDILREKSGASPRDRGEKAIEWTPL